MRGGARLVVPENGINGGRMTAQTNLRPHVLGCSESPIGYIPIKISNEDNDILSSPRDFLRTASLATAAVASGIGVAAANGQTSTIDGTAKNSAVPSGMTMGSEVGAKPLRGESPLSAIDEHVCGLHFYSGDINRQVILGVLRRWSVRFLGCCPSRFAISRQRLH